MLNPGTAKKLYGKSFNPQIYLGYSAYTAPQLEIHSVGGFSNKFKGMDSVRSQGGLDSRSPIGFMTLSMIFQFYDYQLHPQKNDNIYFTNIMKRFNEVTDLKCLAHCLKYSLICLNKQVRMNAD